MRLEIPDPWQQEAIRHLRGGADVVIDAPTGAGKTRVFEWWVESAACKSGQIVFTVPTRALANDKFLDWEQRGWRVGLATGDRSIRVQAPILVATLETQRERLLEGAPPRFLAVDEYQLLSHPARGTHYETLIAKAPAGTQMLFLSGSVADPASLVEWLQRLGRNVVLVRERNRPVPLEEFPVERLPVSGSAGRRGGFWTRLAEGVLRAGLAPCLIFAPRRVEAERIAQSLAGCLAADESLRIDEEWQRRCDKRTLLWLRRRLALHHSGLPSDIRAGLIEPLAKFGKLHFIVATTGLAAGINFSVRSVLVAGTRYFDGPVERELRPDELLQMMGRAGRRGLDELGTVLSMREGPGLGDAAPGKLRARRHMDWPYAIRMMETSPSPLSEALALAARMMVPPPFFSEREELEKSGGPDWETHSPLQGGAPWQKQLLASNGNWLAESELSLAEAPFAECLVWNRGSWKRADCLPDEDLYPGPGRLCRLSAPGNRRRYGREEIIAMRAGPDCYHTTGPVRALLRVAKNTDFSLEEIREIILPMLAEKQPLRRVGEVFERNERVIVRWDYSSGMRSARRDPENNSLLNPPVRIFHPRPELELEVPGAGGGEVFVPSRRSELRLWRELGLIDRLGFPTERGSIFSRFQDGEGLLIAAALEERDYPLQELVRDLANLRGGHRFADLPPRGSERLAASARARYGHRNLPGILCEGLCSGYGENTREALELREREGLENIRRFCPEVAAGDLERARLEWLSLLRHIERVAPPKSPRWADFVAAARAVTSRERGGDEKSPRRWCPV